MPEKFTAVIVGGGPVGLGMAHALSLASIDFVLLEQRDEIVEDSGFGIALWPHGVRILDQFGLLERTVRDLWLPVGDKCTMLADTSQISYADLYGKIQKNHGHQWLNMRRRDFVRLLYTTVPERDQRIFTGKKVTSIDTHDKGVDVHCNDGSQYEGSIVIGCDGVYSRTRDLMYRIPGLPSKEPSAKAEIGDSAERCPMWADYQLFFGYADRVDKLKEGVLYEIHNKEFSCQMFNFKEESYWMAYRRLPKRTYGPVRYTEADVEALAAELKDKNVAPGVLFGDVWNIRRWTRLVNIEEGQVKGPWHRGGRVVLVGDAVTKMTPNAGLSLNTGWQGVAELTNRLRALLLRDPEPRPEALSAVFAEYQQHRQGHARLYRIISNLYTCNMSWYNAFYRAMDWAAPWLGGDIALLDMITSPLIRRGIVLDFVPEKGHKVGTFPWLHEPLEVPEEVPVVVDGTAVEENPKGSSGAEA